MYNSARMMGKEVPVNANFAITEGAAVEQALATKKGVRPDVGGYLKDFQPSTNVLELVQQQAGQPVRTAELRLNHIIDGEINRSGYGSGGHYVRSPNVRVMKWLGEADGQGVNIGNIMVRNPVNGRWVRKHSETTFYPAQWSKRRTQQEVTEAFQNSSPVPGSKSRWQGTSLSGIEIRGYYTKPNGGGSTAWPVYTGEKFYEK